MELVVMAVLAWEAAREASHAWKWEVAREASHPRKWLLGAADEWVPDRPTVSVAGPVRDYIREDHGCY